jgi:uncharacterized protein (TIGR02246 family)
LSEQVKLPMIILRKDKLAIIAALVSLAIPGLITPVTAQQSTGETGISTSASQDEKAIRAQASEYIQAFARGDAAALANMWTADGLFTDSDGREYKGRTAIQNLFTSHFKQFGPHPIEINIESVKFPSGNTAIEEGNTRSTAGGAALRFNRYMAFHVKENNQWKMAAVSETGWTPETAYSALKDLGWLVGRWSVKQPMETGVHMNANWVGNRNFIKFEFEEAPPTGSTVDPVKSTQIIGWDPIAKQVVSWHFDSTGGFGYARWLKQGQSWVVNANGVEQDGSAIKANYVINPIDTNMFTWQSTGRVRAGANLPDTPSITVGRDESVQ